ncbi:glycosyltransferase family 4 protein [Desulfogranum japonicum]|uniref:glycosyltransferase family 4 protein n=1 Tax=Desulfogranum japonicum TaxID=231447 RepID=UPI0004039287|nr:glycosyltransferase family 4 protein [Desulfogranum japonicum]
MKICLVTSSYPLNHQNSEVPWLRQAVNLVNEEKDIEVIVFAAAFKGLQDHEIDGIPVKRFRYFFSRYESLTHEDGAAHKIQSRWYRLLAIPYIICGSIQLAAFNRREKFDILHVHWPFPHAILAFFAQIFHPAKIVLNYHGTTLILIKRYPFVRYFQRFFIKHADEIISNSRYTDSIMGEIENRASKIIPYGTTVRQTTQSVSKEPYHIISVGRLIERKGFPYLIRAMPEIVEKWPQARLTIVGGGGQLKTLQQLISDLEMAQHVHLSGNISSAELKKIYDKGSIFVLPSIFDANGETEGLGVVLIEAVVNGCALIGSNIGGIPDVVIHEQTGLLVDPNRPAAIAKAVDRYFSDAAFKATMVKQGQRHVQENFSWKRVTEQLCHVYRHL